jgi:hypothetical protein
VHKYHWQNSSLKPMYHTRNKDINNWNKIRVMLKITFLFEYGFPLNWVERNSV